MCQDRQRVAGTDLVEVGGAWVIAPSGSTEWGLQAARSITSALGKSDSASAAGEEEQGFDDLAEPECFLMDLVERLFVFEGGPRRGGG